MRLQRIRKIRYTCPLFILSYRLLDVVAVRNVTYQILKGLYSNF